MNKTTCQKCGKDFNYEVTDMKVPGGKDREYIYCPYCKEINGSEVTSGFIYSYEIDEKSK
jgi:transposase-like protein